MKHPTDITCLFLDLGGVVLSNGWGHDFRVRAAEKFQLDLDELETRHHQAWADHELGEITMDEYLDLAVFHRSRSFTKAQFTSFICAQSYADQRMLDLIRNLKRNYDLKIVVVSNEGRKLNDYRIRIFHLGNLVDIFVSSCYVHLRKPEAAIFNLALDICQVPVEKIIYLDNTDMFVRIAEGLGIFSVLHTDFHTTAEQLALCGLPSSG